MEFKNSLVSLLFVLFVALGSVPVAESSCVYEGVTYPDSDWRAIGKTYTGWCLNNLYCIDGEVQAREDDPGCSLIATTPSPVTVDASNITTILESSCAPGRWYRINEMTYDDEDHVLCLNAVECDDGIIRKIGDTDCSSWIYIAEDEIPSFKTTMLGSACGGQWFERTILIWDENSSCDYGVYCAPTGNGMSGTPTCPHWIIAPF